MPCEWPLLMTTECAEAFDAATPEEQTTAHDRAVEILWALSGRVFGICDDEARPCSSCGRAGTYGPTGGGWVSGALHAVSPLQAGVGGCGCDSGGCCTPPNEVLLSPDPVQSITNVWIDGVALDPAAYKIRDERWLTRVDGRPWPQCQNLHLGNMDEGAFYVEFKRGTPVPAGGQSAAGYLACELLNEMQGKACRLPRGVTSINRQGVNIEFDPRAFFSEGLVGIDEIDQWLMAVNPHQIKTPPRVYSVDVPYPSKFV